MKFSVERCALGPDEVHVWHVRPEEVVDATVLEACYLLLDADERRRQGRFLQARHRHLYLVAHALVRTTLSRYADTPPEAWQFETNNYGRPEIAAAPSGPRLRFNLSHTGGMAICGVTWDRDLGVDVEDVERRELTVDIAGRYFSPGEVRDLRSRPLDEQARGFFDYWTLKEAYIKARGMGLSLPLDKFSYHLRGDQPTTISFESEIGDEPSRWHFEQFFLDPRHAIAVAASRGTGPPLRIELRGWTP